MPIKRNPQPTRPAGGRKPRVWTAERKEIARRIAGVRDACGSGNKLKAMAGRTAQDWCAPKRDEPDAWKRVKQPDAANLLAFARATGRRIEWILTGEGAEMAGEAVPRRELEKLVADVCGAAVSRDDAAWMFSTGTAIDGAACLAHVREAVTTAVASARQHDATIGKLRAAEQALAQTYRAARTAKERKALVSYAEAWREALAVLDALPAVSPLLSSAVLRAARPAMQQRATRAVTVARSALR
jgi:hypothetical protein